MQGASGRWRAAAIREEGEGRRAGLESAQPPRSPHFPPVAHPPVIISCARCYSRTGRQPFIPTQRPTIQESSPPSPTRAAFAGQRTVASWSMDTSLHPPQLTMPDTQSKRLLTFDLAEISKYGNLVNEKVALRTKGGVADKRRRRLMVPLIRTMSMYTATLVGTDAESQWATYAFQSCPRP